MNLIFALLVFLVGCDGPSNYVRQSLNRPTVSEQVVGVGKNSPESLVGEKLFRENRFSQHFFANFSGQYNESLRQGDSVVSSIETLAGPYPGPYKGQAISCAACHFVDQAKSYPALGVRAYTDFSRLSRIPERGDGLTRTVRNSPNMVATATQSGFFLHADGEFTTPEDLVRSSIMGRNMGWLTDESRLAIQHIVSVVRHDTGGYPTDTDLGGLSYRDLLQGADSVPVKFRIAENWRVNLDQISDAEVFEEVVRLVAEYLRNLDYSRDSSGHYNGSPYDVFLKKNHLPAAPENGESALQYSQRLSTLVSTRASFEYVDTADGQFKVQNQEFLFSERELKGLKVFFGAGRCVQCHQAPDFTDHLFHNTGVSQFSYDRIHGQGAFLRLPVPELRERNLHADLYFPASEKNPRALGLLRSQPHLADPRRADLGVWAVFGNPAMPNSQIKLRRALCDSLKLACGEVSDDELLRASVGLIKTPSVRDLGQSAPYLHDGSSDQIVDALKFYQQSAQLARQGRMRNVDHLIKEIELSDYDLQDLELFLKALNEDYN